MWVGLLQFFLSPYLVGWFWAQYHSYLIVMKAIKSNETANNVLNTVQQPGFADNLQAMSNNAAQLNQLNQQFQQNQAMMKQMNN